ncbi:SMP-30/gluconolactonase/LRE family protein [Kitasatospora sp. NPDC049258]|uniref:SMP-30/gluconolactonase/LRE family protein n=1 Tax=Kitasatospora sp. NPDC049258 TaxID=3155394 RepID=UPI00342F6145
MPNHAWVSCISGRFHLNGFALWHQDRLHYVDAPKGSLNSFRPGAAPQCDLSLPVLLSAVAPVVDSPGEWIVAADRGIARIGPGGAQQWLARPDQHTRPRVWMNGAACDREGRFWVTSTAAGGRPGAGSLYRVDRDGSVHKVLRGLSVDGGPAFSLGGSTLYLADSSRRAVSAYEVDPASGEITGAGEFIRLTHRDGSPSGLAVDDQDCVWVGLQGSGRIHCYTPAGRLRTRVDLPASHPTGIAFGDRHIYVTTALYGHQASDPWAGRILMRPSRVTAPAAAAFRPKAACPADGWRTGWES